MNGIIFTRFCIFSNTDNFNSIADYSITCDYSRNVNRHTIEHIDTPVSIPVDRAQNCCEREVLTEILNHAASHYPETDIWLIIADCINGNIKGIDLGVQLVTPSQFLMCDSIRPDLGMKAILTDGFNDIRSGRELADKIRCTLQKM